MNIVIIIDIDDETYYGYHLLNSLAEASAFSEGMMEAWKISHGPANCRRPYILDLPHERQEWEEMGSPGKEKIQEHL